MSCTISTPVYLPGRDGAAPAESRSVENPAVPLSDIFFEDGGEFPSAAGVRVTRRRAMGYSAIWRGVNLIAGDVGRLAVRVMKREGKGKAPAPDHPAFRLLRRKPNDYMTAFTFRQTLQSHALLEGNGYAYIERGKDQATPASLLILDPTRTYPVRVGGVLWYVTTVPKNDDAKSLGYQLRRLPATDVIHIRGLGFDGLCGYPVIRILRDTIGGALAARDHGTRYFKNAARPGLVLEVPAAMKDTAVNNLRQSWERIHQGLENAHRVGILRDGVKLTQIQGNAKDAQLIENREFDAREIANVLGVPAHKVGDPSRTAYNSLESENQSYYDDTLDRWLICHEEEYADKLLTEEEKAADSHSVEFSRNELMRVNLQARGEYYVKAISTGWLNADEVREAEGRNPIPDDIGQTFYRPANVMAAGEEPAPDPAPADPAATGADPANPPADAPTVEPPKNGDSDQGGDRAALRDSIRAAVGDVAARMARRLATHAERSAKKRPELVRFLDSLSAENNEHAAAIAEAMSPLAAVRNAAGFRCVPDYVFAPIAAGRFCGDFAFHMRAALESADVPTAVSRIAGVFEAAARGRFPTEFCQ